MNSIIKFEKEELGKIRVFEQNGEAWFIGKDVATVLGYKDTDYALRAHVDKEDKLTRGFDGSGQRRNMICINESGLYSLIFGSDLPKAKEFKRWVTSEVLPAIRKTGTYMTELKGQEKMFQMLRADINDVLSLKIKEIEEKCSEYYRPSSCDKNSISQYIKKRLGITKANEEYELVKQRVLIKLGATKWEDIPVETLRQSLNIIDESIRIVKLDRPYQQLTMFN